MILDLHHYSDSYSAVNKSSFENGMSVLKLKLNVHM